MKYQELILLLPCYSLEDLSLDRDPREADQLLGAWSGLFHPVLVAGAGSVLQWVRADDPPEELADRLVVVPDVCQPMLPEGWFERAEERCGCLVRGFRHRQELLAASLGSSAEQPSQLDRDLVRDFLALGFCHFQVELLTRQLRYMSNLDEVGFQRETVAAAEAALGGDREAAVHRLRNAFDLLTEAREYFYPIETYLLDLTLVASNTLGPGLRRELAEGPAVNLLISGEVLERLAADEPDMVAALREAVEGERVTVIGGEFVGQELPLLPPEAILAELRRGLQRYAHHLGRAPVVFGRRRFGMTPMLPQILSKLGFIGAVHCTLDAGRFPAGNQSKVRWQGFDGTAIEALVRVPLDAGSGQSFLKLPERLGDTMDLDHAATAVFAHWPGRASPWYGDIRRMAAYSPVLGRFVTAASYFRDTEYVGQSSKYSADQYRSPYLREAVERHQVDPVSRWVRYYQRYAMSEACRGLEFMLAEAGAGQVEGVSAEAGSASEQPGVEASDHRVPGDLGPQLLQLARRLARRVSAGGPSGVLVINPWSFARRTVVDLDGLSHLPEPSPPVRLAAVCGQRRRAVVDVPPMGFAWIGPGRPAAERPEPPRPTRRKKKAREELPLAEPFRLRNEFFEAVINPVTGAVQAIYDYRTRGSRLTQQIAFRFRPGSPESRLGDVADEEHQYTVMAADRVEVTAVDQLHGEIVSEGRLMDRRGQRVAGFRQTARAVRGSRVLELGIQLQPDCPPGPDPWASYYAVRFAWADAAADLYRGVNQTAQPTEAARPESPYFVEIRTEKTRTAILCGGLPYHRRIGLRKLDTLLVVSGETCHSFRVGIGIDVPCPLAAALDFLAPPVVVPGARAPRSPSAWLFHVAARNVVATRWEPKCEGRRVTGFRVRLLETEGRSVLTRLRSWRAVGRASKVDFTGQQLASLPVERDAIQVELGPYEWAQVEVDFA